jgi:hypothetical protein
MMDAAMTRPLSDADSRYAASVKLAVAPMMDWN